MEYCNTTQTEGMGEEENLLIRNTIKVKKNIIATLHGIVYKLFQIPKGRHGTVTVCSEKLAFKMVL